jgi:hypothetical protein
MVFFSSLLAAFILVARPYSKRLLDCRSIKSRVKRFTSREERRNMGLPLIVFSVVDETIPLLVLRRL